MAKITDRTMATKPTEKDIWISEDAAKGHGRFCLRITKAGEKIFYFRYTGPNGDRVRLPLGGYDSAGTAGLTLKGAREKAGELSRLYQSGIVDIKGHLEAEGRLREAERAAEEAKLEAERLAAERALARLTVQGLFDKWAIAQLSRHKDGGKEITRIFEKDVLPVIGKLFADEVRKGHISEIVDSILARGCNRLAKQVFAGLRQMFSFAVYRDWLDADPTAKIRKSDVGGKDVERDRILNDDEIKQLAKKMPGAGLLPTTQAAVWLCLSTCCRIGELLKARWEHVDFERKVWAIPAENSKNGVELIVALSDFALAQFEVVKSINHETAWLYPNRDKTGPVCVKTITKQVGDRQRKEAMTNRSASVETLSLPGGKWTPHDLRRTGATVMTMLGIAPEVVERCLNHTEQSKVKRIYQRYSYAPEMRHAWELLGSRLEALTAGKDAAKVIPLRQGA